MTPVRRGIAAAAAVALPLAITATWEATRTAPPVVTMAPGPAYSPASSTTQRAA